MDRGRAPAVRRRRRRDRAPPRRARRPVPRRARRPARAGRGPAQRVTTSQIFRATLRTECVAGLALAALGSVDAALGARPETVSVHVQNRLNVLASVHISFHPTVHLPQGGYYYAVVALKPYRHY